MLRSVEPDIEQLERLREGDEKAFVMVVARYHQPLLRLARTLVSSEEVAEEIVQDTWMGVVRGIERFEGRSSFKTWLLQHSHQSCAVGRCQGAFDNPNRVTPFG